MDTARISPQVLLSHADFVAGLARSLLADVQTAEDVAQDTLAASSGGKGSGAAALAGGLLASTAAKVGAVAVAIAIVLVAWRSFGGGPGAPPPSGAPAPADERRQEAYDESLDRLAESMPPALQAESREPAAPVDGSRSSDAVDQEGAAASRTQTATLRGRFEQPDGGEVIVESAVVTLTASRVAVREVAVAHASGVLVEGLAPDVYVARVIAPGFDHRDQSVDLSEPERLASGPGIDRNGVFDERLVLWPAGWVAVIVRTPDGRSFEEIADDLGLERKRVLVDAFEARTRRDPPGADAWSAASESAPAVWRKPPLYQSWSLPGDCIGSLQVLEPPPFWVGLAAHGRPLGWELVSPGASEVVFRLDAETFSRSFATVSLRVLDAPGGAPRSDVRVTLKADTSAHRRSDQMEVAPGDDGRVVLTRVVPGRYELSIEGGDALHQDLLDIAPGEQRDLGDVVLPANFAIPVHAIDAQGKPAFGWVEIAPYRRGARVQDLYPPNLHRSLDGNGEFRLPMPSEVSIVRVTLADPATGMQTERLSPNVLLDPKRPPPGRLELVVREPIEVRFDAPAREGTRIDVRDELDLVVSSPPLEGRKALRTELVPGRYVARRVDGNGLALSVATFAVVGEPIEVRVP